MSTLLVQIKQKRCLHKAKKKNSSQGRAIYANVGPNASVSQVGEHLISSTMQMTPALP